MFKHKENLVDNLSAHFFPHFKQSVILDDEPALGLKIISEKIEINNMCVVRLCVNFNKY